MNMWTEGVRGREIAKQRTPIRNPPIRNPSDPWLLAREKPAVVLLPLCLSRRAIGVCAAPAARWATCPVGKGGHPPQRLTR
eukprot:14538518-Alexandrium_andersonii.AAC.1